ncbi:MAG: transposase family protein [Sterolibacteriaceae bacterium]|nr:transposase family protein [Sterolibacteriaceae bacterium]
MSRAHRGRYRAGARVQSAAATLLKRLRQIQDTRNPKKLKHALVSLMLYGILVFVLHYSSRREANTDITRPMFEHNLRLLFPELDSLPHADTLFRLLSKIDVGQIEHAHIDLVERLIRKKKFANYRINNCYPIAIDGTQKVGGATCGASRYRKSVCQGPIRTRPSTPAISTTSMSWKRTCAFTTAW